MGYVYKHMRLDNGEIFYVGISLKDAPKFKRAFYVGNCNGNGRNIFWRNIINKTDYEVIIVSEGITPEEAIDKEKELIAFYGRRDLGTGSLVNMTNGGEGVLGLKFSRETIEKFSLSKRGRKHTEEAKEKIRRAVLGRKHTEESKARMSIAQKGIKPKIESINKFKETVKEKYKDVGFGTSKIVINLETGIFYISAEDALKTLDLPISGSYFRGMLNGSFKNKTPFIYA